MTYLKSNANKCFYNKQQLQGYFSNTSGHYCIMYGHSKCKKKMLNNLLKKFKRNYVLYNDKLILKIYKSNDKK